MARGRTAPAEPEAQGAQAPEPQGAQVAPSTSQVEAQVDLTAFSEAVRQAVESRDTATGVLPEASVSAVRTAYRALDGSKPKRAAKAALAEGMKKGMDALDIGTARAFNTLISDAAVAGGGGGGQPKAPVDPTEAHVNLVVLLDLARTLPVPSGVAEDWETRKSALYAELSPQLDTYRTWSQADEASRGDEPEVSDLVKQALRLQQGKRTRRASGGNGYTGSRRDIAKHVAEFFSDKESGHFATVSEIVNFSSTEYGDDHPSPGAVLNRIFPPDDGKVTLEGVTPSTNEKGTRGATKA